MTEGGEKQPYRLPGRAYMVMYHMFASGVWTGCEYIADMYRVWSNRVCRLREGWLYRDHQEVGLWCAEDGREQFCLKSSTQDSIFRLCPFPTIPMFPIFPICPTEPFVCVEDFCSTDQSHVRWGVRQKSRYYCLGGLDSFGHLWPGWTYFRHLCGRYY